MAGPGDILGGLAQIGAIGAGGAYQGDIEGRVLKSDLAARDIQNQLGYLRMLNEQQRLTQPHAYPMSQNRVFMFNPATGQYQIHELGPGPLSPLDQARLAEQQSLAELHRRQAEQVGVPKPQSERLIPVPPGQGLFDPVERRFLVEPTAKEPAAGRAPVPHFVTDAQGNVRAITPRIGPEGQIDYSTSLLGQYGRPSREAGAGAGAPRETVTTTTKVTPRKEITNLDEINKVQADLEAITNELAANPKIRGWMDKGAWVQVEGYDKPVRREDIIARAMLKRHGAGVSVRWDGRQWRLVRAWIPEQREPIETRRTTGPPSSPPQGQAEDEE